MPEIHRNTPQYPSPRHSRGRGKPAKNKARRFPPLRTAKGTRAQHAGDARNSPQHPITQQHVPSPLVQPVGAVREPPLPPTSQKYPLPQQRVPSPASHSPTPPRGRLRGGPRVRATGRPWGAPPPPKPPTPTIHRNTPLSHHPILPILSNLSHPSSGVSQSTPISKCPLFS